MLLPACAPAPNGAPHGDRPQGVTIGHLLLLGVAVTGFAYVALRFWTDRGNLLPPASWGAFIVLLFMACGVFFAGLPVRRFLRGTAKKPLTRCARCAPWSWPRLRH